MVRSAIGPPWHAARRGGTGALPGAAMPCGAAVARPQGVAHRNVRQRPFFVRSGGLNAGACKADLAPYDISSQCSWLRWSWRASATAGAAAPARARISARRSNDAGVALRSPQRGQYARACKPRCAISRPRCAGPTPATKRRHSRPCRTSASPRSMQTPTTCSLASTRWARSIRRRAPDCAKLQELTAASIELQATVKAKSAYLLSKIDQMLGGTPVARPRRAAAREDGGGTRAHDAKPATPAACEDGSSRQPAPSRSSPPKVAAKPAESSAWSATTVDVASAPRRLPSPPPPGPPASPPEDEGYTIDEIKAASAGFFGQGFRQPRLGYRAPVPQQRPSYRLRARHRGRRRVPRRRALRQGHALPAQRRHAADLLARALARHRCRR